MCPWAGWLLLMKGVTVAELYILLEEEEENVRGRLRRARV